MIKSGQQFRVDTIKELRQAYMVLPFAFSLEKEEKYFYKYGMRYISLAVDNFVLDLYDKELEVVPNPFKEFNQPKHTGIDKAMDYLSNEAKKLGFSVEVIFKNIKKWT